MNSKKSAILIFSRNASQEAATKTFSSKVGKKGNKRIAELLIQKSINTANRTGIAVFTSFSHQQVGNTFGEKLANAFESVFDQGYQNVIAIGNDCPYLTSDLLLQAQILLEKNSYVLGPSNDGGLYLLGIKKDCFHKNAFIDLAWETKELTKSFKKLCQAQRKTFFQLHQCDDIDFENDLSEFLKSNSCSSIFRKKINNILTGHSSVFVFQKNNFPFQFYSNQVQLRAPPF